MKSATKKGRPREFEMADALDKALLVFWEKGYRNTSLDDLTAAMKINRPSLYAAFGDKEQLFLSTVDYYISKYISPPIKILLQVDENISIRKRNLRQRLTEYFRAVADVVVNDKTPPGCLIACLLSEECCESPVIKKKLLDAISAADLTFQKLFEKHKNELAKDLSADSASKMMTTIMQGIAIRARAGADKLILVRIAENFTKLVLAN